MYNKILSVIIPYYMETSNMLFPILSSLNNQVGIDFNRVEFLLVNDGADNVLSDSFVSLFNNLDIRRIYMPENHGPGVTRQVGIDNSVGEYIMFCDADDVLHNIAVLGVFLQEIDGHRPDIITSPWLEELYDTQTGAYHYVNHDDEITWMHGKVFRRVFLQTKNIRFHDELRVHEDSYFLALAFAATDNKRKIPVTSYLWKYLPDSITRRNGASYTYDSIPTFFRAIDAAFRVLEKSAPGGMVYKVVQFILYNYFTLHRSEWLLPDTKEYLRQSEQAFAEMITYYLPHYRNAPQELINAVYNQERTKQFGDSIETETLGEWLHRLSIA